MFVHFFITCLLKEYLEKNPMYRIEEIMKKHGVICVRLPPYHPELNPIGNYFNMYINIRVTLISKKTFATRTILPEYLMSNRSEKHCRLSLPQ